jgi:hypothetical protein
MHLISWSDEKWPPLHDLFMASIEKRKRDESNSNLDGCDCPNAKKSRGNALLAGREIINHWERWGFRSQLWATHVVDYKGCIFEGGGTYKIVESVTTTLLWLRPNKICSARYGFGEARCFWLGLWIRPFYSGDYRVSSWFMGCGWNCKVI